MKHTLLFLLLTSALFSAEIDTKLFEGENRGAYYKEISAQINTSAQDKEILKTQRVLLERLQNEFEKKVSIHEYNIDTIKGKENISQDSFQDAIKFLANLRLSTERYHDSIERLQSKISYTKNQIENITQDEKPHLLSYQLQFAYYKTQQQNNEIKEKLLKAHDAQLIDTVIYALPSVKCPLIKNLDEEIEVAQNKILKLGKKKIFLEIEREKEVLDNPKNAEILQKSWTQVLDDFEEALLNKIVLMTYKSVCLLQAKKNKAFFDLLAAIEENMKGLSQEQRDYFEKHKEVLKDIAKDVFGSAKLFLGATQHELKESLVQLKEYLFSTLFVFNEQPISLFSLTKVLFLIIISFLIGSFYRKWIIRISNRWPDMSQMSIRLTSNIGYYLIVFIGVMIAISSIGIDMTSISLIAGALSIGVGFGLQTVVSNLIAGIILMFERTIRIGDTIELSDTLRGRVTDMRIRSTSIQTFDNVDIVVPNASFIQNNVINWTLEDKTRRIHIPFGVAYGTEVEDVKKAVLDELKQSELIYIKNIPDKEPEVWMVAMNSSSVDFELLVWVEWASKFRPNALKSDFLILIYNALRKNNIQIPFPQLDLHVKETPSNIFQEIPK